MCACSIQTARDGVVWHWCILTEIDCSICGSIFSAPQGPGWHCWQGEIVAEKTEEHDGEKWYSHRWNGDRWGETEENGVGEGGWVNKNNSRKIYEEKVTVSVFTGYFLYDDSFLIGKELVFSTGLGWDRAVEWQQKNFSLLHLYGCHLSLWVSFWLIFIIYIYGVGVHTSEGVKKV